MWLSSSSSTCNFVDFCFAKWKNKKEVSTSVPQENFCGIYKKGTDDIISRKEGKDDTEAEHLHDCTGQNHIVYRPRRNGPQCLEATKKCTTMPRGHKEMHHNAWRPQRNAPQCLEATGGGLLQWVLPWLKLGGGLVYLGSKRVT
nr:PREDICTED: uncharacterized protein LOC106702771 [Latimeria chalumnae]|eukprot:XP_014341446.1 PREDICTED: uncharacterized protein LOC106702771 [Latimeria chalumnae]